LIVHQKPRFERVYRKLNSGEEKECVDEAIRLIISNPGIGSPKKGDLAGLFVYKFKVHRTEKLLAYTWKSDQIVLVALGTHENFYRDLKR